MSEEPEIKWSLEDLKTFAASACIDVYKDFTEDTIKEQPRGVRRAWDLGRDLVARTTEDLARDSESS